MATGVSSSRAQKMLDALCGKASYTAESAVYVKLHTGEPGAAGTSNAATETTRKLAAFNVASGGSIASSAQVQWTNIAGSQDATHFSAWDDVSAGSFLFSGAITANAYTAGDTFTCPAGSLTATLPVAS